jgi:two-component sensor histidine kinase
MFLGYDRGMRYLRQLFLLCFETSGLICGSAVDSISADKISLLEHSFIYLDSEGMTLRQIRQNRLWKPYDEPQVHTGVSQDTVWLRFVLENSSDRMQHRILVIQSSRLEDITLYQRNGRRVGYRGVSYRKGFQDTLYPFVRIKLPPHVKRVFFLKVKSSWSPMLFGVTLEREKTYRKADRREQMIKILLLGVIFGLMIYSFVLSLYTRDRSYLYYSFYLFAVLYQQIGYMGFSQVYLPLEWVELEKKLALPKVGLMLIATALFAMHFLKSRTIMYLHRGYQAIVLLGVVEVWMLVVLEQLSPETIVWMAKLFVTLNIIASLFNFWAAVVYYRRGNREARLYIVGFGILLLTYLVWTLGTLGWSTLIYRYPNTIILGTTLEALVLSLAFADRYRILKEEKTQADQKIIEEISNREQIVQEEVVHKTAQLKQALDTKGLLLQEVHHRVKNNLQVILSIVRLQRNKLNDTQIAEQLTDLENRINAIAKTYSMLLVGEDLAHVDMHSYIKTLLSDLQKTMERSEHNINITMDIQATIPLRESAYVGLIINELITNAYKYAFDHKGGEIHISLTQDKEQTTLIIEDNGRGYTYDAQSRSLGLKLIRTLVTNQLRGEMHVMSEEGTRYRIAFKPKS